MGARDRAAVKHKGLTMRPVSSAVAALLLAVPAHAAPIPASALIIRQSSPALAFRWRVAPEAAEAPALFKAMRAEALRTAARERVSAAHDAATAAKDGYPFRRYETVIDWSLAADGPRLLALAGETYTDTGGAHGNLGYAVRLWDRKAKRPLAVADLFSDWPRARALIEPVYCAALAAEQAQRRGRHAAAPAPGAAPEPFDACPKLSEQPLVPWGRSARPNQFRVLLAPYVAGPFSEGSYLVTAPWPDGVRALVKPAWRAELFGDGG